MNDDLYIFAENKDITVITGSFPANRSMSFMDDDGETYIGIHRQFETSADERVHLAHEIGHCVRGAFYNIYSPYDVRGKYERQADEWAIRELVPERDFCTALSRGNIYPWQIAEEFNITPKFAVKVMRYYLEV